MVVDVAHHHKKHVTNVDTLPLCCVYNLRVARMHIEDRKYGIMDAQGLSESLEVLLDLENAFCKRWEVAT